MLGKLLKYELKATSRLFVPLYLTILVVSVLNLLFLNVPDGSERAFSISGLATGISMVAYVTLIVGMVVMTLIVLIQRFYRNLLGDEGYLMFTLPVKPWSHIISKLIISMLWTIISGIVAFCSIMIISAKNISAQDFYNGITKVFSQFEQYFGSYGYLVSLEVILFGLLTLASAILTIYAAIALGHLFNKYKLLASFGMYIALKTVSQILMTIFGAIFFNGSSFRVEDNFIPSALHVSNFLMVSIVYSGIIAVGYFLLTNYILKRKLNLE